LHAVDPLASQSKRRIAETSLEISSPDGDANVEVSCDAESNTYLRAFDKRRSRGSDRPPASSQPDAKENSSSDSDSNSESDDSSSSSADSDEEKEKDGNCSSANVQEDKTTLGNDVVADPPGESAGGEVNDSEAADAPTEQSTLELPEVSSMKISQLKKELIQHGIDSSTFCEKQEFIDAVAKARDASSTANGNYFRVEPGEI
jgi:Mg-chelatase subunit ChlI